MMARPNRGTGPVVRWLAALSLLLLTACSTGPRRDQPLPTEPLQRAAFEVPEDQLLDVWIELFDPGELPDDSEDAEGLSEDIRDAEARFLPVQLRNTIEKTGYWGAVRVVPRATEGGEVLLRGRILESDGETLALRLTAEDATGRQWFQRTYQASLPKQSYKGTAGDSEPFEPLYNNIANDLASYRATLAPRDRADLRRIAKLRFAADMAPAAFADYLRADEQGYHLVRLPAEDDPMYRRIQAIRERDALLVDTLNGHFDNFYREMQPPYWEWRKARVEEMQALRKVQREATTRKVLGFAAIAGAIALSALGDSRTQVSTSTLRNVMVLGGAYAVKTGFDKDSEAEMNREAIEELGQSFASEARPLVVEVEGQTHELTGSAEVQYTQWRALMRRIYAAETGLIDTDD